MSSELLLGSLFYPLPHLLSVLLAALPLLQPLLRRRQNKEVVRHCCRCLHRGRHRSKSHLLLEARAHIPVQVVARAEELQETVLGREKIDEVWISVDEAGGMLRASHLGVALPQTADQFITLVRVQVG